MTPEQQKRLEKIKKLRAVARHLDAELMKLWNHDMHDSEILNSSMQADHKFKLHVREYVALYGEKPE